MPNAHYDVTTRDRRMFAPYFGGVTPTPHDCWECASCYGAFPFPRPTNGICPDCAPLVFRCEECNVVRSIDTRGQTVCASCAYRGIRTYDYKPIPKFIKLPAEKQPVMYMGTELEVDRSPSRTCRTHSEIIHALLGSRKEFYCKRDGSLRDGFEIVSHPASYAWWLAEPLAHFSLLAKYGYKSYNTQTCGMHVHVNRDYFTTGELFKLMEFFDENPRFILKISRRSPARLNEWARTEGSKIPNYYRAKNGNSHDDRRRAINLENENTVEFRIFRGTLNIDSFKLNLAFVRTISAYVKDCSMRATYPSHYGDWLKKHRGVVGNGKLATALIQWVHGAIVPDEVAEI